MKRAFTLIELLVSIGIFAAMTALVVAKYGNFNQSVLLTNLAYDIALTIRTAQTYGLSVKTLDTDTTDTPGFQRPYGVNFNTSTPGEFLFFADENHDGIYVSADDEEPISRYATKRGSVIDGWCFGPPGCYSSGTLNDGELDITFKRPDPNAKICVNACPTTEYTYVEIVIKATDGNKRVITVRENGQIAVLD